jgi:hypothetical protein
VEKAVLEVDNKCVKSSSLSGEKGLMKVMEAVQIFLKRKECKPLQE